MKVGVVGLGAMGSPMALNLLDAGHELLVYDLSSSAVAALVAKGARAAVSPREAAAGVDVVLTMVPNDKVLREVTCNSATGLLQSLRGVHLSCSTVHPDVSRDLAALHAQAGSSYVGAPIFARADGVAQRLASFCVGGAADAVERVLPLLEVRTRAVGAGRAVWGRG